MIPSDALVMRARQHYDDATNSPRYDAKIPALTTHEREAMIAWIAAHEDPIRADRSGVFLSGMFLGAIRRKARTDEYDRQARERIERDRVAFVERDLQRKHADEQKRFAAARAKIDFQRGLADSEAFATARAEANASIAEVRRMLRVNHHDRAPTEDEIRIVAESKRKDRWRP